MAPKPPLSVLQARYAALTRDRDPSDPVLIEARREFAFAKLSGHVAEIVARFPPLTEEQCQKVAGMLKAGSNARVDANLHEQNDATPRAGSKPLQRTNGQLATPLRD